MHQEEIIRTRLAERALIDPIFCNKFNDPNKSITACLDFVTRMIDKRADEVHKENKNNCVRMCISEDDIVNFATHYYDEPNDVLKEELKGIKSSVAVLMEVPVLGEAQKEEIMMNAMKRIMKAEEDKIVQSSIGNTPKQEAVKQKAEPKPKLEPKPKKHEDVNQLSLF